MPHGVGPNAPIAWDKTFTHHNSRDLIFKSVNAWRVWWPFTFANKFTAVGGNPVFLANFAV